MTLCCRLCCPALRAPALKNGADTRTGTLPTPLHTPVPAGDPAVEPSIMSGFLTQGPSSTWYNAIHDHHQAPPSQLWPLRRVPQLLCLFMRDACYRKRHNGERTAGQRNQSLETLGVEIMIYPRGYEGFCHRLG